MSRVPVIHTLGPAGTALIQQWEGCARRQPDGRLCAYPDPGSADGKPWTIGWGSTGADIGEQTVWTQAECDARLDRDLKRVSEEVDRALGDAPATQNQFDALVAFHYNTGAIRKATLTSLHKAGRYRDAQAQFAKWIYSGGRPLPGLRRRRAAEAVLYGTP